MSVRGGHVQDVVPGGGVDRGEDDVCYGGGGRKGGFYGRELRQQLRGLVGAGEVQEVVDLVFGEEYRGGCGRGEGGHLLCVGVGRVGNCLIRCSDELIR